MLDKLPLKEDFTENANVVDCFNYLYHIGHPVLKNDITRVINNCCYILLEGKGEDRKLHNCSFILLFKKIFSFNVGGCETLKKLRERFSC